MIIQEIQMQVLIESRNLFHCSLCEGLLQDLLINIYIIVTYNAFISNFSHF